MTGHETEDENMGKKKYESIGTVDMGNEEYAERDEIEDLWHEEI